MRDAIDSFLKFLSTNLSGVPVHAMRFDKNKPELSVFQQNALNVHFLNMGFDTKPSTITVSLDLIYDRELDAVDAAQAVMRLMNSAASTPKLDYTNPASPVPTKGWIYWGTNVTFRPIVSDTYAHLNATITLTHYFS